MDAPLLWLILHAVPASRGAKSRAVCGLRRASTVAGPRLMQGKRKRRHLHPVAVYFKGIIRRLPVVFRLIFRRQTVQPAPAFLLRCGFGDALASSAFRPAVVSARRKPELRRHRLWRIFMSTTTTTPAVYVGTYHKYNCGSIFGKWFDLTEFDGSVPCTSAVISSYRVEKASKQDGRRPARRAPVSPRENPGRLRLPERNFAAPPAPRTLLPVVSR